MNVFILPAGNLARIAPQLCARAVGAVNHGAAEHGLPGVVEIPERHQLQTQQIALRRDAFRERQICPEPGLALLDVGDETENILQIRGSDITGVVRIVMHIIEPQINVFRNPSHR